MFLPYRPIQTNINCTIVGLSFLLNIISEAGQLLKCFAYLLAYCLVEKMTVNNQKVFTRQQAKRNAEIL
jgi:hypothetical protein